MNRIVSVMQSWISLIYVGYRRYLHSLIVDGISIDCCRINSQLINREQLCQRLRLV